MDYSSLKKEFNDAFGYEADKVYFAPGRINLIGEHTDYNGGNVFPCAISMGRTVSTRHVRITRSACNLPTFQTPVSLNLQLMN